MADLADPTNGLFAGVLAAIVAGLSATFLWFKRMVLLNPTGEKPQGVTNASFCPDARADSMQAAIHTHDTRLALLEADIKRILDEMRAQREEDRDTRKEIFKRLGSLDKNTSAILAVLDDRRPER